MAHTAQHRTPELTWWPIYVLLAVIAVAALLPTSIIRVFDLVGYAVCHRIPERSFFIAGTQLPLCARDTGMFSAALLGVLSFIVVQPLRVNQFPARPYVFALAGFFLAWAFDGVNSYLLLARREVFLYMPQNWLRLVTGALMGVTLASFVVPLFNSAVWRPDLSAAQPSVASWRDVARLVAVAGVVIAVVLWQPDFLYGPIAVISGLGVVFLLVVVNTLLVVLLMRKEARIERWSELTLPLIAGVFFTFTEIMLIVIARAALTEALGLPF
ncbi:MAG: DUF2085 domain-containing protein [Candidatus Roseilinea sp.]|uniref:DUF2085 domain-containing protein n=1 Tax=Candidatus Roseilinea sp. TaxID=2838777 RepID=UPI004049E7E8